MNLCARLLCVFLCFLRRLNRSSCPINLSLSLSKVLVSAKHLQGFFLTQMKTRKPGRSQRIYQIKVNSNQHAFSTHTSPSGKGARGEGERKSSSSLSSLFCWAKLIPRTRIMLTNGWNQNKGKVSTNGADCWWCSYIAHFRM